MVIYGKTLEIKDVTEGYTKEQVEKMEEIRRRIVNKIATHYARYWYDETYRNTEGEAFKRRLLRDMDDLENDIGYKLT